MKSMAVDIETNHSRENKICSQQNQAIVRVRKLTVSCCRNVMKAGRDDPRRVIHAFKVGLALTLVSFLYLFEPLFAGIGQNAMWAVMTVVVVLEFTAGATLCKGVNRGFGTLCAGSLAFFIEFVAEKTEGVSHAVFIGASVFLVGFISTYLRIFPNIKKNYDYGVMIFLLTFNLITVSSYRVQNVQHMALERLYMITIGCGICLFMSILIFPNWSGEDLHSTTVRKFEVLARSIEDCVNGYFQGNDAEVTEVKSKDAVFVGYKSVLESKSIDETLATFASWEPRHSIHCHKCPWKQYVKLGAALRHFGYTAAALHGCLQSEIQAPKYIRSLFKDPCIRVTSEVSKILLELANSIRNHNCFSHDVYSDHLHDALQDLNSAIRSQPRLFIGSKKARARDNMVIESMSNLETSSGVLASSSFKTDPSALLQWKRNRIAGQPKDSERKQLRPTLSKIVLSSLKFSEILPFAAFTSLLVEMVARLELVIEEAEKLGREAHFKEFIGGNETTIKVASDAMRPTENSHDLHTDVVHQIAI